MEDESQIFNLDVVKLSTILDRQPVTSPADYVTAVTTLVAMYWVFDVAFPNIEFSSGACVQVDAFRTDGHHEKGH